VGEERKEELQSSIGSNSHNYSRNRSQRIGLVGSMQNTSPVYLIGEMAKRAGARCDLAL
jgi:hypothetical protein